MNLYITQLDEDDVLMQGKSFEIPKSLVWRAYLAVKRNRGAAGIDRQTIADFDANRDKNLYKLWNRLSSGSYLPPPVRAKRIPKGDGKERTLGIPTVSDRIAQGAVKLYAESYLEPIFHADSYGYRPRKSAHQALATCATRCQTSSWVLEVDIKAFFDHVSHDLVLKALKHHKMPPWVLLYCGRWLRAPLVEAGADRASWEERTVGTPQGGVISPLLANLFLHYAFDRWMEREQRGIRFERYADDIVVHCSRMTDAQRLKTAIEARFDEVGLTVNDQKSHIVYIDTFKRQNVKTCFTFLGYDFKVRTLKNFKGELYRKCMPGASSKAMRNMTQAIRGWQLHRSSGASVEDLARRHNATLRGWIAYYGKFWYRNFSYRLWSVFQSRLLKWVKMKFRVSNRRAERMLGRLRKLRPTLFAHWYLLRASNV